MTIIISIIFNKFATSFTFSPLSSDPSNVFPYINYHTLIKSVTTFLNFYIKMDIIELAILLIHIVILKKPRI